MPVLLSNRGLTPAEISSSGLTILEPSVAKHGNEILLTGNAFAMRSSDGGTSWSLLNPATLFPAVDGGFCCDQTVLFKPAAPALTFWILQYWQAAGTNTLRVAVNRTANMANNGWYWWDFKPVRVNSAWVNEWFDFNHAALSDNFLYVGSNVWRVATPKDVFARHAVLKLPLATLATGGNINYNWYQSSIFNLRCTQGARGTMYFAGHNSASQIRVYSWSESTNRISQTDINISPWTTPATYSAPCNDGTDWLSRCDGGIMGAWVAGGEVGFAWTAGPRANRPFPYVRVVRLREGPPLSLLTQQDIFNSSYAYAWPEASPNSNNVPGISLFRGGGAQMPGHVIGCLNRGTGAWELAATKDGSNGPTDGTWGDYLSCRQDSTNPAHWVASGYTLEGGGAAANIMPRYVRFSP